MVQKERMFQAIEDVQLEEDVPDSELIFKVP